MTLCGGIDLAPLDPLGMHLGEVSGMAASLAIKNGTAVQKVDAPALQAMIKKQGIPLEMHLGEE